MDDLKWVKLTEVFGRMEADLLESYLTAQGIEVELFQEAVGHHIYPTTIDGLAKVQIFVNKDQVTEARSLLERYNQKSETEMQTNDTIFLVTHHGMGKADEALQKMLIVKFFELMAMQTELPAAICFYTDGVKLACEGSPVIEQLRVLETKGVRLILCSTCLNYFDMTDKIQVGIVGSMADILEAQMKAGKVISI